MKVTISSHQTMKSPSTTRCDFQVMRLGNLSEEVGDSIDHVWGAPDPSMGWEIRAAQPISGGMSWWLRNVWSPASALLTWSPMAVFFAWSPLLHSKMMLCEVSLVPMPWLARMAREPTSMMGSCRVCWPLACFAPSKRVLNWWRWKKTWKTQLTQIWLRTNDSYGELAWWFRMAGNSGYTNQSGELSHTSHKQW